MIGTANKAADLRNYAYSGAMVDNVSLSSCATLHISLTDMSRFQSITSANVPDTKAQFASFIADIKSGLVPALPKGSRTLIAVWIGTYCGILFFSMIDVSLAGINPLMEIYFSAFPNRTPVSASTFSSKSGGALSMVNVTGAALVQQIASLQASLLALNYPADIMVLPLSPLNELPFAVYTAGGNSQLFNFMQTMADAYNAVVQAGVAQLGRTAGASIMPWVDLPTYYRSVVSNPSSVSTIELTIESMDTDLVDRSLFPTLRTPALQVLRASALPRQPTSGGESIAFIVSCICTDDSASSGTRSI